MDLRHWQESSLSINWIATMLGLMLSLTKICETQELDKVREWKYPVAEELRDPVISGIQGLEYLRRLVIDDSRDRKSRDRVFSSIDNRESDKQGYFSDSVKEDAIAGEKYQSRRQVNSAMYEALSRLANVRVDETSRRGSLRDEHLEQRKLRESAHDEKNLEFWKSQNGNATRNESSLIIETPKVFDSSRLSRRKFQCSSINEIYIPNVDKKMPAYLCALGRRAFVVSSERFNQESRERFSVSLDDDTYMRLNPIRSGSNTLTSAVSVLPATLVLKRGDVDYTVRGRQR